MENRPRDIGNEEEREDVAEEHGPRVGIGDAYASPQYGASEVDDGHELQREKEADGVEDEGEGDG